MTHEEAARRGDLSVKPHRPTASDPHATLSSRMFSILANGNSEAPQALQEAAARSAASVEATT